MSSKIRGLDRDWGDPNNPCDRLGNYLKIKERLLALIDNQTVVLEIGSLGGKWVQCLTHAKKIICVDINELGFKYIKEKIAASNLEFYLSRGDELSGIADNSVGLVFSMDTLVRVEKKCLRSYFREAARVLKPKGRIFFHLPCTNIPGSRAKRFIPLSLKEIEKYCRENKFNNVNVNQKIIKHGIILEAIKG